jgi:NDP-sugar pyrophosphorylase family protein
MNIIIPMAGRGHRFASVGVDVPKPMIPVRGVPMYAWAVASLPLELASRLIFICLEEHLEGHPAGWDLAEDIRSRYREYAPEIVPLNRVTEGQAATVLEARERIDPEAPLLIYNADTYMVSDLGNHLGTLPPEVDGVISVFRAEGDRWSFARTEEEDGGGRVVETAEKRRISDLATTGLYHFTRGGDFLRHADAMIAEDDRSGGEFYVIPVYNRMIAAGAEIRTHLAGEVWVLGTPEDLAHFESHYTGEAPV